MPVLEVDIPTSLKKALESEAVQTGRSVDAIITSMIAERLDLKLHTVFQVSTSGALVAGVFDSEVTVGTLLEHGDFGLGTFSGLDGEMVVFEGQAYQAHGSGQVTVAGPEAGAPFAIVTKFAPEQDVQLDPCLDIKSFEESCDHYRPSDNLFYAMRLDGVFRKIKVRTVNPPAPGTRLVDAAKSQSVFDFTDITGTLVGIWSPSFSSEFSVRGYHFHFLSEDRAHGGHLLELETEQLRLQVEPLNDFRLILPETEHFLKADLSKDISKELDSAEKSH
jgi:acetolactate decarboxylase